MGTLMKICKNLNCGIMDVIELVYYKSLMMNQNDKSRFDKGV